MILRDELYDRVVEHYAGPVAPLHRLNESARREVARWCTAMDAHKVADGQSCPLPPPTCLIGGWSRSPLPPLPPVPRHRSRLRKGRTVQALAAAALVVAVVGCGDGDANVKHPPRVTCDAGPDGDAGRCDAGE